MIKIIKVATFIPSEQSWIIPAAEVRRAGAGGNANGREHEETQRERESL